MKIGKAEAVFRLVLFAAGCFLLVIAAAEQPAIASAFIGYGLIRIAMWTRAGD